MDKKYGTADVARIAGVHRDTLLRWLREGRLPEPERNRNGWRVFTEQEKDRVMAFALAGTGQTSKRVQEGGGRYKQDGYGAGISRLRELDWDFATAKTAYLTHALHPYPAKFIPQIPNALIQELSEVGDRVLDPFCGSGTTLVEAIRLGRNAVGLDANPLACLISRAKTCSLSEGEIAELETLAADCSTRGSITGQGTLPLFPVEPDHPGWDGCLPETKEIGGWFSEQVIHDLGEIRHLCYQLRSSNARIVALVAFSSIIVGVSFQDSETRYVRRDKGLTLGESFRRFASALTEAARRAREFAAEIDPRYEAAIFEGDVLEGPELGEVDLVVCSPPYPNAFSYHLYHRTRMVWLGMDYKKFKQAEIGSHRKYSAKGMHAATAETFAMEMELVFGWLNRTLRRGKFASLVIGNSIIRGERVNNEELVIRAAARQGFALEASIGRRLQDARKSFNPSIGKIKEERIVILRRTGG